MQDGNRRQSRQPDRGGRRRRSKAPAERAGIRLAHYLAMAGVSSRRKCEEYITSGRTTVDGEVVKDFSFRVEPTTSDVRIDGERVRLPPRVYFMINKPPGVICTNRDPAGRTRVIDLFPPMRERLFTVGRLDENSEGMLIVTNDGDLAHQLAHPRFRIPKYYKVHVAGVPDESDIAQLRKGMRFAEGWFKVENVRLLKDLKRSALLSMVLSEGQNREIRRLLARLDHKVLRLKRVGLGTVRLGETPLGAYRALTSSEIASLWELIRSPRPVAKRPVRGAASSGSANRASQTGDATAGSSPSRGDDTDAAAPRGRQPRHKPHAPAALPASAPSQRFGRRPASAADPVVDESVEEYAEPLFDDEDLYDDDDDRHDLELEADAEAFDDSNADESANADFDEADLDVMGDDFDDEELFDGEPSTEEDDGEPNKRGAKGRSRGRDAIDFSQEEPADEAPRPARSGWKFERRPPRPSGPSRRSRAARPSTDVADEAGSERRPRGRRGAPDAPEAPAGTKPARRPSRGGRPRRTAGSSTGEVQSFAEGTTPPSRRRGRHAGGRRPQRAGAGAGTSRDDAAAGPPRRSFGGPPGAKGKRPPRPARHRDAEHAAGEAGAEPSPGPKRGGGRPQTGRSQARSPQTDRPQTGRSQTGRRRPPRDRGDDAQRSAGGGGRAAEGGGPAGGAARSQRPRRQKPKRRRNRE